MQTVDHFKIGLCGENSLHALADEIVVFREHDANRHRRQAYEAPSGQGTHFEGLE